MLFAMQAPEPSWSKILAAILGVLGFVLSCYNYVRLLRKDKEERKSQQWQARTDFNERRQEAIVLIMGIQLSVEHNREVLKDVSQEAARRGRTDVVDLLKGPLEEAEKNVAEIAEMMQEVLSSIPPSQASAEQIQELMAIYDEKALVGLKMRHARIEEHIKKVDTVVEAAKQKIGVI